jgi:hypothetical protein
VWGDDKNRTVWYRRGRSNSRVRRHLYEGASPWKQLQRKENDSLTCFSNVLDYSVPWGRSECLVVPYVKPKYVLGISTALGSYSVTFKYKLHYSLKKMLKLYV